MLTVAILAEQWLVPIVSGTIVVVLIGALTWRSPRFREILATCGLRTSVRKMAMVIAIGIATLIPTIAVAYRIEKRQPEADERLGPLEQIEVAAHEGLARLPWFSDRRAKCSDLLKQVETQREANRGHDDEKTIRLLCDAYRTATSDPDPSR